MNKEDIAVISGAIAWMFVFLLIIKSILSIPFWFILAVAAIALMSLAIVALVG